MSGNGDCRYAPDVWCVPKDVERRREFVGEQVRWGSTISAPPVLDFADLHVSFRGTDIGAFRLTVEDDDQNNDGSLAREARRKSGDADK